MKLSTLSYHMRASAFKSSVSPLALSAPPEPVAPEKGVVAVAAPEEVVAFDTARGAVAGTAFVAKPALPLQLPPIA